MANIWIQEELAGFEFQYKSLNFPPSCPDYPWCNYERQLLYKGYAITIAPKETPTLMQSNKQRKRTQIQAQQIFK